MNAQLRALILALGGACLMLSSAGSVAIGGTLGSVEGDITLIAGNHYQQTGGEVLAPGGDIRVLADSISIEEARESPHVTYETKAKQSGLTVALSSPVVNAVQGLRDMSEAASQTSDGRMQALAAASAGLGVWQGYQAIERGQGMTLDGKENQIPTQVDAQGVPVESRDAKLADRVGGIDLSISLGTSKSRSRNEWTNEAAAGATLAASGDITLIATGTAAGANTGDIPLQGGELLAGRNLSLLAEDEIRLLAARNSASQHGDNKSSSASVGVSIGTSSGLSFNVAASQGKAVGDETTWTNTHLQAGETLTLQSGGDTTLQGAVAAGQRIEADIGGHLTIKSRQDESTYESRQKNIGLALSIGTTIGGSLSVSQSKIDSDYRSVTEQSGLFAGDSGFQIEVQGDTTLTGGVIASTEQAVQDNKNRLTTGTLSLLDLENKAEYDAESYNLTLGAVRNAQGGYVPQGAGAGIGEDSGEAQSTSKAGISGGLVTLGNKSFDTRSETLTDSAGKELETNVRSGDLQTGLEKIFDADKVQREIDAQVAITQRFGQQAAKAIGDYAATQLKEAELLRTQGRDDEASAIESQWGEAGTLRLAAHTAIGGLTGGSAGASGALAGTLTAPIVAGQLKDAGIDGALADTLTALASTTAGTLAGGSQGAATALNEVTNNFLKHDEAEKLAAARQKKRECQDAACQQEAQLVIDYWESEDHRRDLAMNQACLSPSSAECLGWYRQLQEAQQSYDDANINDYSLLTERKQIAQQTGDLSQRIEHPTGYNIISGAGQSLGEPITALGDLVALTGKALTGDEKARQDLKKIANAVGEALANPIDTMQQGILDQLELADRLEAQGKIDEATQLRSKLVTDGLLTVTGVGSVAVKGSGTVVKVADDLVTQGIDHAYQTLLKLDAGAVKRFRSADELNALMTSAEWKPAWKPGTQVAETTLAPGTRVQMVVDKAAFDALGDGKMNFVGNWATFDEIPNQAFVRNNLAITNEFKKDVGYVVELEITKPLNAQVGIVGSQGSAAGGANQVNFMFERRNGGGFFKLVSQRVLP